MRKESGKLIQLTLFCLLFIDNAQAVDSPEQRTLEISRFLRPISDDQWESIAGDRLRQMYDISPGDNLSEISGRLFGDPKYWPKIWAVNNGHITNPHLIFPGNQVAFVSGSGSSLPSLTLDDIHRGPSPSIQNPEEAAPESTASGEAASPPAPNAGTPTRAGYYRDSNGRSTEWQYLPNQNWEQVRIKLPSEVDPLGFDRRNKIHFREARGITLEGWIESKEIATSGEIAGSPSNHRYLSIGEIVFVELEEGSSAIGKTYTITLEPTKLSASESDDKREAFVYTNIGTLQIDKSPEGDMIGTIIDAKAPVPREALLIPKMPNIHWGQPVASNQSIEGHLLMDRDITPSEGTQYKLAFVDRGSADGVKENMVFRTYLHKDPVTDTTLTDEKSVPTADFLVVHVSEEFSTLLTLQNLENIPPGTPLLLLNDVSDLMLHRDAFSRGSAGTEGKPSDEMDELKPNDTLSDDEKDELKALESDDEVLSPDETDESEEVEVDDSGDVEEIDENTDAQIDQDVESDEMTEEGSGETDTAPMPEDSGKVDDLDVDDSFFDEDMGSDAVDAGE